MLNVVVEEGKKKKEEIEDLKEIEEKNFGIKKEEIKEVEEYIKDLGYEKKKKKEEKMMEEMEKERSIEMLRDIMKIEC